MCNLDLKAKGFLLAFLKIVVIAAVMSIWIQIIGRYFLFRLLARMPVWYYRFAVPEFSFIFWLIAAAFLVKMPGTVSITIFLYNIISESQWWFGAIHPLWWLYPFMQGVAADYYLLLRGRGVFTDRLTLFKFRATPKEPEVSRRFLPMPIIDGAVIGFLRGFFMQLSLYKIFYPSIFHVQYDWNYAFWWMTIPWAIGNAIEGALSVLWIIIIIVIARWLVAAIRKRWNVRNP